MSYATPKLGAMLVTAAMLAACGGSGGGDAATGTASQENASVQAASFADCLILTPGTKFTYFYDGDLSHIYTKEIVHGMFNGQMAYGEHETYSDGTDQGTSYYTLDSNYYTFLGHLDIDGSTQINTDDRLPLDLKPGQTVSITHTATFTQITPPDSFSNTDTDIVTFVGFEDITMGSRTFKNTCKIANEDPANPGEIYYAWIAKGFGNIRYEVRDANGALVPTRNGGLLSVLSAP